MHGLPFSDGSVVYSDPTMHIHLARACPLILVQERDYVGEMHS